MAYNNQASTRMLDLNQILRMKQNFHRQSGWKIQFNHEEIVRANYYRGESWNVISEQFPCCIHLILFQFFNFSNPLPYPISNNIDKQILLRKSMLDIQGWNFLSGIQYAFSTTTLHGVWVMGVGGERAYSTGYSQTVSFSSTKQIQFCLASQIAGLSDGKEKQSI